MVAPLLMFGDWKRLDGDCGVIGPLKASGALGRRDALPRRGGGALLWNLGELGIGDRNEDELDDDELGEGMYGEGGVGGRGVSRVLRTVFAKAAWVVLLWWDGRFEGTRWRGEEGGIF